MYIIYIYIYITYIYISYIYTLYVYIYTLRRFKNHRKGEPQYFIIIVKIKNCYFSLNS